MKNFRNFTRPSVQLTKKAAAIMSSLALVFMLNAPAHAVNADTTAPAKPVVNQVSAGSTKISGTAEMGATVTVTFSNAATVTADRAVAYPQAGSTDASFTATVPSDITLKAGDSIKVSAQDAAGNVSEAAFVTVVPSAQATPAPAATPAPTQTAAPVETPAPQTAPNTGSRLEAKSPLLVFAGGVAAAVTVGLIARRKRA